MEKYDQDREWLLVRLRNASINSIELFLEKVARFVVENGMTDDEARDEAFKMIGTV